MWKLQSLAVAVLLSCASAATPIHNLQVTLRGHKYEISGVETVQQLQDELQKTSGVSPKQQGRVLFGGKRLTASQSLEEAGVTDGAKLNLVPGKTTTKSTTTTTTTTTAKASSTSSSAEPKLEGMGGMDMAGFDDFIKSMGGGGGENGKPPNMEESMEMMSSMMNSPIFQEYMSDPEKLEQSRQMILQNPLLKSMMGGMPGMEELLNDPVAWREAMTAAANIYKNMDKDDLMKAMMGDGMPPPGIFDGSMDSAATTAALDELSEGDD